MELPIKCKERITKLYPINGNEIITNSENLIDKIVDKYKLENAKIKDDMSYNIIIDAYSNDFKDVIVKIETSKDAINREIEFYKTYSKNNNVCELYDSSKEMNYLIMKKIATPQKLDSVKNFEERLQIYKEIFQSLNQEQKFQSEIPLYKDIFINSAINCKDVFLQPNIDLSKKFLQEIEDLHLTKYVLHGDMHHWNIILDNNKWKLIDPAGYVAEKVFDLVVFMQNEFWKYCKDSKDIKNIIIRISQEFEVERLLLLKALYINVTLTIIWNLEDHVEKRVIDNNLKTLSILNDFIKI